MIRVSVLLDRLLNHFSWSAMFLALMLVAFNVAGFQLVEAAEESAVAPKTVQGTPEDTTLTAQVVWARTIAIDERGVPRMPNPYPMQINLDLTGEGVNNICAFGLLTVKNAAVKGGKLKFVAVLPDVDLSKSVFPYTPAKSAKRKDDADLENEKFRHPLETLRVPLRFEPPTKGQSKIDAVEGSVKLITAGAATSVVLEDLVKLAQRPTDPVLKDANLKLSISKDERGRDQFVLAGGKGTYVGKAHMVEKVGNGTSRQPFRPIVEKGQAVQGFSPSDTDRLDRMTIEVKVFSKIQEKVVTFKFVDLPLPAADSKPTEKELRREILGIN